ncbi:MAG: hypothetical protein Ct9H300mP19_14820 [Dehalococcoidia bacterium]|nr:MAG: hypothetical protein Ct9H300mP19_14820 [Dehalococcoidia bacterium]
MSDSNKTPLELGSPADETSSMRSSTSVRTHPLALESPVWSVLQSEVLLRWVGYHESFTEKLDWFQINVQANWNFYYRPLVNAVVYDSITGPVHLDAEFF